MRETNGGRENREGRQRDNERVSAIKWQERGREREEEREREREREGGGGKERRMHNTTTAVQWKKCCSGCLRLHENCGSVRFVAFVCWFLELCITCATRLFGGSSLLSCRLRLSDQTKEAQQNTRIWLSDQKEQNKHQNLWVLCSAQTEPDQWVICVSRVCVCVSVCVRVNVCLRECGRVRQWLCVRD